MDSEADTLAVDRTDTGTSVVEIDKLARRFGKKCALENINLTIPRGSVFGLVGENGAGKTTLIKHILGLLKPQQGSVQVFGFNPVTQPVEVLSQVGYLSEDRDLPLWMTVAQLLNYNAAFYQNWDAEFAEQLRAQFDLEPQQKLKKLSRGQLARTGLIIALAHRPELLILDEPSSGLDPLVRRDILTAIIRTVADEGRTVLFSSHLLDEVERVADWVAMLHHGRLAITAPLAEVLQSHRRLVVRFQSPQATTPQLPGALACFGAGQEWTMLCNGGLEELRAAATLAGAEICEEESASLNEIFLARAKQTVAAKEEI